MLPLDEDDDAGLTKAAPSLLKDVADKLSLLSEDATESDVEQLLRVLQPFQEEPQFLDPLLESLVQVPLNIYIHSKKIWTFNVIYALCKIRGAKVVCQFFPSKVSFLEDVVEVLEVPPSHIGWQARYGLLLWLSILVLAPFQLDTFGSDMASRIYSVGHKYLFVPGKERDAAALVVARLVTRRDCSELAGDFLSGFDKWDESNILYKIGMLQSSAILIRLVSSEECQRYFTKYIHVMTASLPENSTYQKFLTKNLGRLALAFLKQSGGSEELPAEVELILSELLIMMGNKDTLVRYAVAKAVARIVQGLPDRAFQNQVIDAIFDVFEENVLVDQDGCKSLDHVSHHRWHGILLCIAELLRRRILETSCFDKLLQYLRQGLHFEQKRLTYAVGSNVRDAACYVCWSLFRTYKNVDKQFLKSVFKDLVSLACLDREVNIRRAASAALQEGIGRLGGDGSVEHGLELIQKVDYFRIGLRTRAYLEIAADLYDNMGYHNLVDDLIQYKVTSWDADIRRLAGLLLGRLFSTAPGDILHKLLLIYRRSDMDVKHGVMFAISEALYPNLRNEDIHVLNLLDDISENDLKENEETLHVEVFLRLTKCLFNNYAILTDESKQRAHQLRDKLSIAMELTADNISALGEDVARLMPAGFLDGAMKQHWISRMKASKGCFVSALGEVVNADADIFQALIEVAGSALPQDGIEVATKVNGIKSLTKLLVSMEPDIDDSVQEECFKTIVSGLSDYTVDSRGDVGSRVREQAVISCTLFVKENMLPVELTKTFVGRLVKMSVEVLDKLRSKSIATILEIEPSELQPLLRYLRENEEGESHFAQMLHLLDLDIDEYFVKELIAGYVTSAGAQQASELTLKQSRNALLEFLQTRPEGLQKGLLRRIINLIDLRNHSSRIACSALKTMAEMLSGGYVISNDELVNRLYVRTYNCHINTCALNRLVPAIHIFGALAEAGNKKSLERLLPLCKHRYPSIRSLAAETLYVVLLNGYAGDETALEMMSILEDKDWDRSWLGAVMELSELMEKLLKE